jgi:hypothetical protein
MRIPARSRLADVALACIALLTLSFGVARAASNATSDAWFDGTPPDGSFRVQGPVAFEPFAVPSDKEGGAHTQGVRATRPGAFGAVTKYVASCVVDAKDQRPAKVRLEETLIRWHQQADFAYRRDVANGALAGVEFQMSDPQKTLRLRVFAPPGRVCTAFVQWAPVAKPREADIERFLASFTPTRP